MSMPLPSRRSFLQAAITAVASLSLPRRLRAGRNSRSFWFLHAPTGESWQVDDPVAWCLKNAKEPVLERATEGLSRLTPADDTRIIRLLTRRCKLNLIEVQSHRVIVHFWGQQGQGDLRPFFKRHGLARQRVEVVLLDRKRETSTHQNGDDYLYGDRLAPCWPWKAYARKWRRFVEEPDDRSAAPQTWSGYAWEGVEANRIPWPALKSAWRRTDPVPCPNCDGPTVMTNFGFPWRGMFNRYPSFLHACGECRRLFEDDSVKDVAGWMVANLDADVLPAYDMVWDRPRKWEPPGERLEILLTDLP
jgi:hypothetical protein